MIGYVDKTGWHLKGHMLKPGVESWSGVIFGVVFGAVFWSHF